ncbi:MAG: DUF4835 family protein [Dysgonamonadaceae bacterium]|jgi:hypothetical protein|nr:DUF4835 family protein [Dysgonamonadaceae bacterium]
MKRLTVIFVFLAFFAAVRAVELNATVKVNSDRIESANQNLFSSLEQAMNSFINNTQWSSVTFANNERIDCNFSLNVLEQTDNTFKGELYIQARRPVYNSTYITSTLNYRDRNVEFEYRENQPLEIVQTTIDNNLVAVLAFYCNLIMAFDFDSFSPQGGTVFLRNAQNIANTAQSAGWAGWSAFDDNRSKSSIINIYLDEQVKPFRDMWYTYHRRCLDEMAANPDRGRTTMLTALPVLKDIKSVRNTEILLQMFGDCKLTEIVSIAAKANTEEKKNLYDMLRNVFPASSSELEPLKR